MVGSVIGPRAGSTHWSSRKLAAEFKLPFMTVQHIWRKHNGDPRRGFPSDVESGRGLRHKASPQGNGG
jgi:hypothetical protein